VRWRVVVERQVIAQVLPRLTGTRALLEPAVWELLVLCLDGPEAATPGLDEAQWAKAELATTGGRALQTDEPAAFPRAAAAVRGVLVALRQAGVYPPPKA
jgi:hypothetical protein